ncbi:MAG: hypothetical protein ACOX87_07125 [Chloroflexota bacterium]|jgi:hypothetical protein
MKSEEYVDLLTARLAASYNVEKSKQLAGLSFPLYAKSHVVAAKYIFHRSVAYEQLEINEHVFVRVLPEPVTQVDVSCFVDDMKRLITHLVRPSYEHMSSAFTGVLVADSGFTPEATEKVAKTNYTRHFLLGLRGWCFFRLLGIDLASGQVAANRRGKEVMKAYNPGQV